MQFSKWARRLCTAAVLWAGSSAFGGMVSFERITSNSSSIVGAQFNVDVSAPDVNHIAFELTNSGPLASSATHWYFDLRTNLFSGITSIDNSHASVDFAVNNGPPNLPGANNASPPFVTDFRVGATPPTSPNGVGAGEYLGVTFGLLGGVTLQDVMDALANGNLRFGLHIQSLPDGESDSYVNGPPIPSPAAFGLGLIGCALTLGLRRRF